MTTAHYFSKHPKSNPEKHEIEINFGGFRSWRKLSREAGVSEKVKVFTSRGVFSGDGLDKGTEELLDNLPELDADENSNILDLGAGWGAVSLFLATLYPSANIYATEVNSRAIELARLNFEKNGADNVKVVDVDSLNSASDLQKAIPCLDYIVSNPPIRIGKNALYEILRNNLKLLKPSGKAYFVMNKNLGGDSIAKELAKWGYAVKKLSSSKGFRVFEVSVLD